MNNFTQSLERLDLTYAQIELIKRDVERFIIGKDYIFDRVKRDYLVTVYNYLKGKNDLRAEQRRNLREDAK